MKALRITAAIALVCLTPGAAPAQAVSPWSIGRAIGLPPGFRIAGSSRLRYETLHGAARAGVNADDHLTNLRTLLLAEYRDGPLTIAAELWDSRVWGGDQRTPLTSNEVNTLEPVQAYVGLTLPGALGAKSSLALTAGRFLANVGSRRLISSEEYRNTNNGFTGLRADAVAGPLRATAFYFLPQMRRPDDYPSVSKNRHAFDRETFDLTLWGGTLLRDQAIGTTGAELSFVRLRERDMPGRPTRDRHLSTIGARLIREPAKGAWDHEFEGFYQFGHASDGTTATSPTRSVSAWFLHAEVGRSLGGGWAPHVAVDLDIASGDRPGGRNGHFDSLYGVRRSEFSPGGIFGAIFRANIIAPGVRFEATPGKSLDLLATYKPLWLESRSDSFSTTGVRDVSGRSGRFAAHQIDLRTRYWLVQDALRLEIDGVYLAKGRFLLTAPNISSARDTAYLSLNATAFF